MIDIIKAMFNKYFLPSFLIVGLKSLFFQYIGKYQTTINLNITKILPLTYPYIFQNYFDKGFISYKQPVIEVIDCLNCLNSKIVGKATINYRQVFYYDNSLRYLHFHLAKNVFFIYIMLHILFLFLKLYKKINI